ncbi:hypothetical protein F0562_024031 [Nyssa sinensis]|uniref:Uncharacterized protein n=1 Tax=Nyssa sinensis TaxID=561372 RepID=A0A5J5BJC1_9ASTE|nr:hypothetical protein F0562_024031 [Nyssa sinensis]
MSDGAPPLLAISTTYKGLPQALQSTVPPVATKASQLTLAPFDVASPSHYESPHIIVAHSSDGAHYSDLCASHGTAKWHGSMVTGKVHCGLQQPSIKGTVFSISPAVEAHSLPSLAAGSIVVELQLQLPSEGPSNLQHSAPLMILIYCLKKPSHFPQFQMSTRSQLRT